MYEPRNSDPDERPTPTWIKAIGAIAALLTGVASIIYVFGLLRGVSTATDSTNPLQPLPGTDAVAGTATAPPPTRSARAVPFLDRTEIFPGNGTTMSVQVSDGELRVVTSGPICVDGTCFPGGETRGTVVAMLPRTTPYTLTHLVTGKNWLGVYIQFDGSDQHLREVVDDRVASMHQHGNCTGGKGCDKVDVLIIGPTGVVRSYLA